MANSSNQVFWVSRMFSPLQGMEFVSSGPKIAEYRFSIAWTNITSTIKKFAAPELHGRPLITIRNEQRSKPL